MRKIVFLVAFLSSGLLLAQNSKELDRRNGFKDIKLLSDATTNDGLTFWKHDKEKT